MTARRTVAILAVAGLAALGSNSSAMARKAHATPRTDPAVIVDDLGCATHRYSTNFTVDSTAKVEIEVVHRPGAWGTSEVERRDGTVVWSFTQPSSWIWGDYKVHSPTLPAGDYVFRYWTHNPAQLHYFCHGTARQV